MFGPLPVAAERAVLVLLLALPFLTAAPHNAAARQMSALDDPSPSAVNVDTKASGAGSAEHDTELENEPEPIPDPLPLTPALPEEAVLQKASLSPWVRLASLLADPLLNLDEKAAVARSLAGNRESDVVAYLTTCAMSDTPEATYCLMALVAQDNPGVLPVVRQALRSSTNPGVVATGCLAVGRYRDVHSRSLVMRTILEERGGTLGALACIQALQDLGGSLVIRYEMFAWRVIRNPAVRSYLAKHIMDHSIIATRDMLRASQLATATQVLSEPQPAAEDLQALLISSCSLSESGQSNWTLAAVELGAAVRSLPATAPQRCVLCSQAAAACSLRLDACDETPSECGDVVPPPKGKLKSPIDYAAFLAISGAPGYSGAQWDAILLACPGVAALGLPPEFLQNLSVKGRKTGSFGADMWSPTRVNDLRIRHRARNLPVRTVETRDADTVFPEDFYTFQPDLRQPEWWDSDVVLTIDDGPTLNNLPLILDSYDKLKVKGVFFFVGHGLITRYAYSPDFAVSLINRVLESGHAIGYHTMEHNLKWPNHIITWDYDQIQDDVELFRLVLEKVAGRPVDVRYGRTPGGLGTRNQGIRKAFQISGLRAPIGWTHEFRKNCNNQYVGKIAATVPSRPKKIVVLMHEYSVTPQFIDTFTRAHHSFRTPDKPRQAEKPDSKPGG